MGEDRERRFAYPSRVRALWLGEAPLGVAFWWYAIMVGTLLNVVATLLFVALSAAGAPDGIAAIAFLLPVPYNLFAVVAVWRSAGRYAGPPLHVLLARLAVILWAIAASFT